MSVKGVYRRHSPKCQPVWMTIGRYLFFFVYGIHLLVGSVWPSRCMGGSRTNENDFVFYNTIYHNSSYIQRISNHKCVGSGFWCRKNISEASNVGGARAKTAVFQYPAHSLQEKFYCKLMVPMETLHCEGVPCGGHNPPDINDSK